MSTRQTVPPLRAARRAFLPVLLFLFATLAHATPVLAQCDSATPSVTTDQTIYTTATAAVISGCGYSYKEPLNIVMTGQDGRPRAVDGKGAPGPLAWQADESGAFTLVTRFRPAPFAWRLAARDFGRFTVTVSNAAGAVLAETSFVRLPPRYATCSSDPEGGPDCWGHSTSHPDFFWQPPTVPVAAHPTGPFDATALTDLEVDICELDERGTCITGPPVAHFTADGFPIVGRIRLLTAQEAYAATWITALSRTRPGTFVRVIVRHLGEIAGTIDLAIVRRPADLSTVDSSRHIGVVFGSIVPLRFRIQQPTARTRITINEVESSGGVPGDWVEFYNSAPVPVSLAGYRVLDNDDSHVYTVPDGTMVPARGHAVIDEAALDFGLGGADSVRLTTPDGRVLVDSHTWTSHAATTYGRCPDGSGDFKVNTSVTKGAPNDCSLIVRINEAQVNGGADGNWVELFNAGPAPADVADYRISDNDDSHGVVLPSIVVPAGGYLRLDESGFGFSLDSVDAVRLFRPDGTLADSFAWTAAATTSWGRCPNGSGPFSPTLGATPGASNACFEPVTGLHINEVESNGGSPGDWFELVNAGLTAVDLSGWSMLDNDDTHQRFVFPAGSTIAPGGYFVVEEAQFGFGLGGADSVRIFDAGGALYESHAWTAHATTTYGRCPDGTGAFLTSTTSTKGAANDCGSPIRINEVESDGGVPGDWVELFNPTSSAVDVSGLVVRDNDDTHAYTIPIGTSIAAGGYLVVGDAALGFGLGSADSVRLFDTGGVVIDAVTWTAHAATSWGRCPNGTGAFAETTSVTQGSVNACPGDAAPWPGDSAVETVDGLNVFGGNMSGLVYEASATGTPGVLWAARNGPGTLFRLVRDGALWTPDAADNWIVGKALAYPDATGNPDAEGVTFAAGGAAGGVYVSTERDNNASAVSRNSILRVDVGGTSTTLVATHEWNLTSDLPAVGANLGMEGIAWIPDAFLVGQGFTDEARGGAYDPANYPGHGAGLFFVGLEANGTIYGYALNHADGSFTRVATVTSGMSGVMDLHFDGGTGDLWAVCDDTCGGVSTVLRIEPASGRFSPTRTLARPAGMPNLNNEGFALEPLSECVAGQRAVFWSDDSETDGHAIRSGRLACPALP